MLQQTNVPEIQKAVGNVHKISVHSNVSAHFFIP